MIPIVAGAPVGDYLKVIPRESFIHVDDFGSIEGLVSKLNVVENSEIEYRKFFQWRTKIDRNLFLADPGRLHIDHGWCKLCNDLRTKSADRSEIKNLHKWWYGFDSKKNKNMSVCF